MGWPMAMAPPSTLTFSGSMPSARVDSMAIAAKASLISTRSRSSAARPSRRRAAAIAFEGCSCSVESGPATVP